MTFSRIEHDNHGWNVIGKITDETAKCEKYGFQKSRAQFSLHIYIYTLTQFSQNVYYQTVTNQNIPSIFFYFFYQIKHQFTHP